MAYTLHASPPEVEIESPVSFNNYFMNLKDQDIDKKMNGSLFLKIVYLHQCLGITYGGWQSNKVKSNLRRNLLILFELFTIIIQLVFYIFLERQISARLFESESRKIITSGIIRLAGFISMSQVIIIRSILFSNGNELIDKIIDLFNNINCNISYRRTILFIISHAMLYGFSTVLLFLAKGFQPEQLVLLYSLNIFIFSNFNQIKHNTNAKIS